MNRFSLILTLIATAFFFSTSKAQTAKTAEDSLDKSKNAAHSKTYLGGYGNVFYQYNTNNQKGTANLERFVLFAGHKFNDRISFFSELEVEGAKVAGGEEGGEIALEQAYLKFNLNSHNYIVAGLFLPRIGILNENHLPTTFHGNKRSVTETILIPSTWREIGVGFYGNLSSVPLTYYIGLTNGLNCASFQHGNFIRNGRFEGRDATANNIAVTGALQYMWKGLKLQTSGYFGGSAGLNPREADSLQLESGLFGSAVTMLEADAQYSFNGIHFKALGCVGSIPEAKNINRAFASNTPLMAYGGYAEAGYNILQMCSDKCKQQLIVFGRYEMLDLNAKIPDNGINDPTLKQSHIITGFSYLPIPNVIIKADVHMIKTGAQNPALIINPNPNAIPYKTTNNLINLGVGYSF